MVVVPGGAEAGMTTMKRTAEADPVEPVSINLKQNTLIHPSAPPLIPQPHQTITSRWRSRAVASDMRTMTAASAPSGEPGET
jgi:hypothetical protein